MSRLNKVKPAIAQYNELPSFYVGGNWDFTDHLLTETSFIS